ncbi:TerD family protein [Nocardia otitidiscaviarum]|uniref:TerD family protein n=1 Tax=Nocardia otitidiscaviarum TaxID=1823 RepID=UPI00190F234D|nr:TerD family protein [Nocardia otitidiscaviarum]
MVTIGDRRRRAGEGWTTVMIDELVVRRTLRVPAPAGVAGDGSVATRQFDAVLMSVGFKLSEELFDRLSALSAGVVIDTAVSVLAAVRGMVGDHVQHNVYFRDFPRNVPDTVEFWAECLVEALAEPEVAERIGGDVLLGSLNLLDLPKYGRYQHDYADMLAAHAEFIAGAGDRVTVLHAGGDVADEAAGLYRALAGAATPGNDDDREALRVLARYCATDPRQPHDIPVRENRALINAVRLDLGLEPLLGTVTDALRLACAISGGDVTLVEPTRFRTLPRSYRRALLAGLHRIVLDNPSVLGDVSRHREQWKRLGERLHPHEYPQWPRAAEVFAVARGELDAESTVSRFERLMRSGRVDDAAAVLRTRSPGLLFRSADRVLRASPTSDQDAMVTRIADAAPEVSGRVLLSLREHLENRDAARGRRRVFINRSARGHAIDDERPPISRAALERLRAALDGEIRRRHATLPRWVVDPDMLNVALPISGKSIAAGFGTLPRGSVSAVDGRLLRFFVYWRERQRRTDFDLSALMLDARYGNPTWLSYTNLTAAGGCHSGDITEAPFGASEFIEVDLAKVPARIVIPQVNIYSGEGFDEVAESFFGFMLREGEQRGAPFEPRTVRMKSDLRGAGRVALPLAFVRGAGKRWRAVWTHLHLSGQTFNRVENNRLSTVDLIRSVVERRYLTVGYLAGLLGADIGDPSPVAGRPITYVGREDPGQLPNGSIVITPKNLAELVPV